MRESTAYQAILDEGRAEGEIKGRTEGRAEEARQLLLRLGRKKLGVPDAAVERAICALEDVERLEMLSERLLEVNTWQELLQTP